MSDFSKWFHDFNLAHDFSISARHFQRICHFAENVCESPIEQKMLGALIWADFGFLDPPSFIGTAKECEERAHLGDWEAFIIPQWIVPGLNYRADFFVSVLSNTVETKFVVECDGHDFHERTKQQAARDRKRDRDIQGVGLPILRFTGSEIFNDLDSCLAQINDAALGFQLASDKANG